MASTDTTDRSDSQRRRPGRLERLATPRPPLHPSRLAQATKRVSDSNISKTFAKALSGSIKGPR